MTVSLKKVTVADLYPGWRVVDCGCCNGLKWGGEVPAECDHCEGSGQLWVTPSGTRLALWPGGPFAGVASESDRAKAVAP